MAAKRLAFRYAKSLLDLAIEQNVIEDVIEDINAIDKAIGVRDFHMLLKSPIISADKKGKIFESIFGGKIQKLTSEFFKIVLKKGREAYLPEIVKEFLIQYKSYKHVSSVKLITAQPLDAASLEKIKEKLTKSSETDDNIEIETAVDPALIGGFKLEFDNKVYDSSVAHKLEQLKKEFSGNLYVREI